MGSMRRCGSAGGKLALATALTAGCHSLADYDVAYVECIDPPRPYVEQFNEGYQGLYDRCWKAVNVTEDRRLEVDRDLLLGYEEGVQAPVTAKEDPPMLLRRMQGNFVMVTHLEVTEGIHSSFCLEAGDAAGIAVRGTESGSDLRSALLIEPDLSAPGVTCQDTDETPPPVRVSVGPDQSGRIYEGGEADIAVCRNGNTLAYYFRQPDEPDAAWVGSDWVPLLVADTSLPRTDMVGAGPLDVGLVTVVGENSLEAHVQGAFNWVAVLDLWSDCRDPLEEMSQPPND
jgi:hypothetical protein